MDSSSYTYEGDVCIHTDPATGFQYKWNSNENKWEPKISSEIGVISGEGSKPKYEIVGNTYVYKDESGRLLEWDLQAKEWRPKVETQAPVKRKIVRNADEEFDSSDESDDEKVLEEKKNVINHHVTVNSDGLRTYTDPSDGTIFEWDEEKKAWFPKLDEEFIARYQLSYGGNVASEPEPEKAKVELPPKPEKKQVSEPNWFEVDQAKNTKVYVSNLPSEITEEEFVDFMQKCGMVEKDLETGKYKIKLYRDETGEVKGDALCTYIKVRTNYFLF